MGDRLRPWEQAGSEGGFRGDPQKPARERAGKATLHSLERFGCAAELIEELTVLVEQKGVGLAQVREQSVPVGVQVWIPVRLFLVFKYALVTAHLFMFLAVFAPQFFECGPGVFELLRRSSGLRVTPYGVEGQTHLFETRAGGDERPRLFAPGFAGLMGAHEEARFTDLRADFPEVAAIFAFSARSA
jgi:hypothetical protein